jgi:peptide/nickel transport system permease protein
VDSTGSEAPTRLGQPAPARHGVRWRALRRFTASKVTLAGVALLAALLIVTALAPAIAPYDPAVQDIASANEAPSASHVLGTDQFGRDVFSRILWGTRISLAVGLFGAISAGIAGSVVGSMAGYVGGRLDRVVMRVSDLIMSFPTLLLGVMIAAALGPGVANVVLAISIALFPRFVRLARASSLSVRTETYVEAAAAIGQSHAAIVRRHILPNIAGALVVASTLWIGTAIRLEASLSFLGLGTQPPAPSWGNMIRDGMNALLGSPWPTVFAGLAIIVSILAFNMVGDALRDALDPEIQD